MTHPTPSETAKIVEIADRLGVPPAWLDANIALESNYNPTAKNAVGSARGLIQVIDSTARGFPWYAKDSAELFSLYPDFESQMENVVYRYYQQYQPFMNAGEFWLATFLPAWRKKPLETHLPASITSVNPGIDTLADYVSVVSGRVKTAVSGVLDDSWGGTDTLEWVKGDAGIDGGGGKNPPRAVPALILAGIAVMGWVIFKKRKR